MWVEEKGLVFVMLRRKSSPRIEPCAEVAARRPRFVWAARRTSAEGNTLLRTTCRHQDSQESSGDDKMAPYRVQARAPPHAIRTAGEPEDVPYASGHGEEEEERRREERRGGEGKKREERRKGETMAPRSTPQAALEDRRRLERSEALEDVLRLRREVREYREHLYGEEGLQAILDAEDRINEAFDDLCSRTGAPVWPTPMV